MQHAGLIAANGKTNKMVLQGTTGSHCAIPSIIGMRWRDKPSAVSHEGKEVAA